MARSRQTTKGGTQFIGVLAATEEVLTQAHKQPIVFPIIALLHLHLNSLAPDVSAASRSSAKNTEALKDGEQKNYTSRYFFIFILKILLWGRTTPIKQHLPMAAVYRTGLCRPRAISYSNLYTFVRSSVQDLR